MGFLRARKFRALCATALLTNARGGRGDDLLCRDRYDRAEGIVTNGSYSTDPGIDTRSRNVFRLVGRSTGADQRARLDRRWYQWRHQDAAHKQRDRMVRRAYQKIGRAHV